MVQEAFALLLERVPETLLALSVQRFLKGSIPIAQAMCNSSHAALLPVEYMDDLVRAVGITKGHASTNLRALLRLGLVSRSSRPGDRKDYYTPQSDLWAFARSVLREE